MYYHNFTISLVYRTSVLQMFLSFIHFKSLSLQIYSFCFYVVQQILKGKKKKIIGIIEVFEIQIQIHFLLKYNKYSQKKNLNTA